MTDLRDAFAAAGCKNVRTYIQSGNVVFECSEEKSTTVFNRIRGKLRELIGSEPGILFRSLADLESIVKAVPFKSIEAGPEVKLYVAFLNEEPRMKPKLPLLSS